MPNDEKQDEVLDVFHHCWKLFFPGKLYLAPINRPERVHDIGTGTGIWAIEIAEKFPNAKVTGTDISPTQTDWVPPNLKFEVDDCNLESSFNHNIFDFIHARDLSGCISDCYLFVKRQFDNLKRGGWFEYKELSRGFKSDGSLKDCNWFNEWGNLWKEAGSISKRPFTMAEDGTMEEVMKRAGFENIVVCNYKMPVGRWPKGKRLKEIGEYHRHALTYDLEGFVQRAATKVGWEHQKVIVFASEVRRGLRSPKHHLWREATVIYGQKPYDDPC
ncbi:UMTA methyltransferase family protein [Dactylonectria estremocensis]|uniref:UMTA methyltransferase family protein n=1 Tax=Dactylonectria estremocensis TaxID=1079267 RepID=A0A9P9I6K6_9HYPO|nr:UMTA methyltransferase family protein [Dactylonectria estremocensis]